MALKDRAYLPCAPLNVVQCRLDCIALFPGLDSWGTVSRDMKVTSYVPFGSTTRKGGEQTRVRSPSSPPPGDTRFSRPASLEPGIYGWGRWHRVFGAFGWQLRCQDNIFCRHGDLEPCSNKWLAPSRPCPQCIGDVIYTVCADSATICVIHDLAWCAVTGIFSMLLLSV